MGADSTVRRSSQVKKDYFWNTLSSVMAAASTVIMLLVVTRVMGDYSAGIFALALTVGQQFQTVGAFEFRPFHATDIDKKYSFGTYHASRILTTLLMIAAIAGFAILSKGMAREALLIMLVAALRAFDSFEDVFHGEFQRIGRLDIGARAFFFRTFVTTVTFTGVLIVTRDLMGTCLVTIAVSLIALVALNLPAARRLFELRPRFSWGPLRQLLWTCTPLFIGAFLSLFLASAPRFAIDRFLAVELQTYYAVLFMPALVINLLSLVLFKPLLTLMAQHWTSLDFAAFRGVIRRGLLAVLGAFAVTFLISLAVGLPLLGFVYSLDLSAYRTELLVLVAGGAMNAAGVILYYALVTMRRQRAVLIGYVVAAVTVTLLAWVLTARLGMLGAALAYCAAMTVLALVFALFYWAAIPRGVLVTRGEQPVDGATG